MPRATRPRVEWPTIVLIVACTATWLATTYAAGQNGWWPLLFVTLLSVTLHSSLQHEVLHGHPTRNRLINEALVFFPIGLFFPFRRFRTLHLTHHNDSRLTDPYEDPESNYFSPEDWERLPRWMQRIREANNTLIGRLTIGPFMGVPGFWASEFKIMLAGDRKVLFAWGLHALGLVAVLYWVVAVARVDPWLCSRSPIQAIRC
jgi:fatty acid desaturase